MYDILRWSNGEQKISCVAAGLGGVWALTRDGSVSPMMITTTSMMMMMIMMIIVMFMMMANSHNPYSHQVGKRQ